MHKWLTIRFWFIKVGEFYESFQKFDWLNNRGFEVGVEIIISFLNKISFDLLERQAIKDICP